MGRRRTRKGSRSPDGGAVDESRHHCRLGLRKVSLCRANESLTSQQNDHGRAAAEALKGNLSAEKAYSPSDLAEGPEGGGSSLLIDANLIGDPRSYQARALNDYEPSKPRKPMLCGDPSGLLGSSRVLAGKNAAGRLPHPVGLAGPRPESE